MNPSEIDYAPWKVVRQLGQGSFGSVYEIRREEFGETYTAALKVISIPQDESEVIANRANGMDDQSMTSYYNSVVQELTHEFAILSKLKGHTNIVGYEDHKVVPHANGIGCDIYIRMELLKSLTAISSQRALERGEVLKLGLDICEALSLCESKSIIHRDIKPDNIFISENGDFELGDFGIARTASRTVSNMSRKGTPNYMAPEVYKNQPYNSSVDIYSLGIVLYQLMNNRRLPFIPKQMLAEDRETALGRRMSGEPLPPPEQADPEFARIILKACAYNPNDRYISAEEMKRELKQLYEKEPGQGTVNMDGTMKMPEQYGQNASANGFAGADGQGAGYDAGAGNNASVNGYNAAGNYNAYNAAGGYNMAGSASGNGYNMGGGNASMSGYNTGGGNNGSMNGYNMGGNNGSMNGYNMGAGNNGTMEGYNQGAGNNGTMGGYNQGAGNNGTMGGYNQGAGNSGTMGGYNQGANNGTMGGYNMGGNNAAMGGYNQAPGQAGPNQFSAAGGAGGNGTGGKGGKKNPLLFVGIGVGAVILLLILLVAVGGSSGRGETASTDRVESEAPETTVPEAAEETQAAETQTQTAETQTQQAAASAEDLLANAALEDFVFELEGYTYQLPINYADFVATGWTLEDYSLTEDMVMAANSYEVATMTNGISNISVYIYNMSGNSRMVSECRIGGIWIYAESNLDFAIAKGISCLSTADEVQEAFGAPSSSDSDAGVRWLTYDIGDSGTDRVRFYINEDRPGDNYIEMTYFAMTADDVTEVSQEAPEYLSGYVSPAELGEDTTAPCFALDGKFYQLPCPVSEFLSDGWAVTAQDAESVGSQNTAYGALQIQKGNATLSLDVTNFAMEGALIENCAVTGIEFRPSDMEGVAEDFVELPGGLNLASTVEEVEAACPDFDISESYGVSFSYRDWETTQVSISYFFYEPYDATEEGQLELSSIQVECTLWSN